MTKSEEIKKLKRTIDECNQRLLELETVFKVGKFYGFKDSKHIYLCARVDRTSDKENVISLVSLFDGNRYYEPMSLDKLNKYAQNENWVELKNVVVSTCA